MHILEWTDPRSWNSFVAAHAGGGAFLQGWEWGSFQERIGKKVWRFGIVESNDKFKMTNDKQEMIAVVLVVKQPFYLGQSWLWSPRGPIIARNELQETSYEEEEVYILLIDKIKEIATEEKAVWWRIEPPEANVKAQIPNVKSSDAFGFRKATILRSFKQPEATLMVGLSLSEEVLLKRMHEKTRYNIRLSARKGVKVVNSQLWDEFDKLMQQTADRDKIRIFEKEYYVRLFEVAGNSMNVVLFCAEHKKKILAAAVVVFFGDTATYLYGASSNEQRNLMAPYALHWEIMKFAKQQGYRWYDFWGVAPQAQITELRFQIKEKNTWQGITRFKRGFVGLEEGKESGTEVIYPGAFDFVLRKGWYTVGKIGKLVA